MGIKQKQRAFTIVELLIVIVVIAILAVVTTVAFSSLNTRGKQALVSDALAKASKQLEYNKVDSGTGLFATTLAAAGITSINGTNLEYSVNAARTVYCVTATKDTVSMYKCTGQNITNGVYAGSADPDAPLAHSDPNAPPPVVEVASSSMSEINTPAQTIPVTQTLAIPGTLSPTDTVFVIYNVDFYSHKHTVNAGGTQFSQVYRKTTGASGYQQTVAYQATGMSGTQSLVTGACYGGNNTTACNTGTNVKAQYMIFVIKGRSGPLTLETTDTSYGSQANSATLMPAAVTVSSGHVAFFAYVYYGNNMPILGDVSSPSMSWTSASTRTSPLSRPGSNNGTALAVSHAVAQSGGTATRSLTTPSSGAVYGGATLFVLK